MTLSLRDAGPADAEELTHFFKRSFTETFAHLYSPDDLDFFLAGRTPASLERELRDPEFAFRIVEQDGAIVGYVKLGPPTLPFEPVGRPIELRQLYVASHLHGSGVAGELTDWALAESRRRNATDVYLSVFVENHRARRFYDRYGFEPVGRYDFVVGNHVDEDLVMRKRL